MNRKIAEPAGPSSRRKSPSRRFVADQPRADQSAGAVGVEVAVPAVQEPGLELRQARAAEHERRHPADSPRMREAGHEKLRPAEAQQQRGHEERRRAEEKEVDSRDDRADGADEVLRRGIGRGVLAEGHPMRQVAGHVGDQRQVEQHAQAEHEQGGDVAPGGGGGRGRFGDGPGHGWSCLWHRNGKRRNRKPNHSRSGAGRRKMFLSLRPSPGIGLPLPSPRL